MRSDDDSILEFLRRFQQFVQDNPIPVVPQPEPVRVVATLPPSSYVWVITSNSDGSLCRTRMPLRGAHPLHPRIDLVGLQTEIYPEADKFYPKTIKVITGNPRPSPQLPDIPEGFEVHAEVYVLRNQNIVFTSSIKEIS